MERGESLTLETSWALAKAWFHDRLDEHWQRMPKEDIVRLFSSLGTDSPFWELG
jgi:hypothetical protein